MILKQSKPINALFKVTRSNWRQYKYTYVIYMRIEIPVSITDACSRVNNENRRDSDNSDVTVSIGLARKTSIIMMLKCPLKLQCNTKLLRSRNQMSPIFVGLLKSPLTLPGLSTSHFIWHKVRQTKEVIDSH